MPAELSPAQQMIGDVAPKLAQLTDDVLFGDVWERPGCQSATAV
jgi:4-carboxymuconolactone decarboxylase